jgi:hypothetical protein
LDLLLRTSDITAGLTSLLVTIFTSLDHSGIRSGLRADMGRTIHQCFHHRIILTECRCWPVLNCYVLYKLGKVNKATQLRAIQGPAAGHGHPACPPSLNRPSGAQIDP